MDPCNFVETVACVAGIPFIRPPAEAGYIVIAGILLAFHVGLQISARQDGVSGFWRHVLTCVGYVGFTAFLILASDEQRCLDAGIRECDPPDWLIGPMLLLVPWEAMAATICCLVILGLRVRTRLQTRRPA